VLKTQICVTRPQCVKSAGASDPGAATLAGQTADDGSNGNDTLVLPVGGCANGLITLPRIYLLTHFMVSNLL